MSGNEYPLGTIVEVSVGAGQIARGVIRFSGPTQFRPGKWVGVELYDATGKNDGSVEGVQYFHCKPKHGVFVRASQIKQSFGSERDTAPGPSAKTAPTRPAGHQRTNSLRSNSLRTTSPSSASRSNSPVKPSIPSSPKPPPRGLQPSPTKRVALKRNSLIAPSAPSHEVSSPLSRTPSHRAFSGSSAATPQRRVSSPLATPASPPLPPAPQPRRTPSPTVLKSSSPSQRQPAVQQPPDASPPLPSASRPSSPLIVEPIGPSPLEEEIKELRAKIRVLEAKRTDDSRHVRELENKLSEAESFVAIRPKLQAKLTSQHTELTETKRELADAQQLAELAESRILDAQEQLEMAMLDKEVAEERAEMAEQELDDVKEKLAIAEVELEVLKEEGAMAGEGVDPDAGKDSLAYVQLEKQNERLKEALLRLRDMTQENEQEQRRRINEMERDITGLDDLKGQYDTTLIKLNNAEVQIEDLKMQLDDALGAEDMLVKLTEQNLMLKDKIEEMRVTIEDLEALKELNDELEENHVETERQLLEDIETRDTDIRDLRNTVDTFEERCLDYEGTIEQFRDLVTKQTSELNDLRTLTQTAQTESATAASQTAAIMSLNIKLQSSAAKNQAKNIELELKRLEAAETRELLGIVQPYLPQIYVDNDSDATSCYLFFQRLGYKTELISSVVADVHGLPKSLNGPGSEALIGACELRRLVGGLTMLCKRFAAVLRKCDVQTFLNVGRLYPELAPMEKRIDMHIDLLRRDEFRESECVSDIVKIQAQFDHLSEMYFSGFEHDVGEREKGTLLAFDSDLDMFVAAIGFGKTSVEAVMKDDGVVSDMGESDLEADFLAPMQRLLDVCASAKNLSRKLTKRMDELVQSSGALKALVIPQMNALSIAVQDPVEFAISLAQQILPHINDVRNSKTPFKLDTILGYVKQVAGTTVGADKKPGVSPWEVVGERLIQLTMLGSELLPSVIENDHLIKLTGTSPWVTRVAEVKASLAVNLEAERKVAQLNDEIQGLIRNLKTRDQNIQEAGVKIELMERRIETYKKQETTMDELQTELGKSRKQEKAYEEAMEQLQSDMDNLEQENVKLKASGAGQERQAAAAAAAAAGPQPVELENVQVEGSLETNYLLDQIDALRGTIKYLKTENTYLKGQDLLREIQSLPKLYEPASRTPTPPLEPSGLSDTDDEFFDPDSGPPPTLRSLATETKMLYRDVIRYSSSPKVVDLAALHAKRQEAPNGRVWLPRKKMPAHQVWERKMEGERLSKRVKGLLERANVLGS